MFRSPTVGLYFLAPLVAEFFLGDFPVVLLPLILPLSLWYGSGAVLVREISRRLGRGWPTILLLGLAFGVIEEGLLTMSLFDPDYAGGRLLDKGFVPELGIGIPWTIFVLGLHVLWSIATPIALVEEARPDRRTEPWLGDRGLMVVAVLFVLGAVVTFSSNCAMNNHFVASAPQLISSTVVAALLIGAALSRPRVRARNTDRSIPPAWMVFALTLLCAGAFQLGIRVSTAWIAIAVMVAALGALACTVAHGAQSSRWGATHRFAVAAGLLLTYTWRAFTVGYGNGAADLVLSLGSYLIYAAAGLLILRLCWQRVAVTERTPQESIAARRGIDHYSM